MSVDLETNGTDEVFAREINEAALARWRGDFAQALDILLSIYALDDRESCYTWNNFGQVMTDLGAFKGANHCFNEALILQAASGDVSLRQDVLMGLTYSALRLKKWDEAFKENRWFDARFARSWGPPAGR